MRYVTVRYGQMYYRGYFLVDDGLELDPGVLCLIKSPRGTEMGKVLNAPIDYEGEILWLKNSKTNGDASEDSPDILPISGEILRVASEEDIDTVFAHFGRGTREEEEFCNKCIKSNELPMKLAGVEYLFEGEKIIFYFLADGRVDFRNLVKDLAKKYRTRIEMKQIGVRDEARLLADYEHCGRRLCCKNFLNSLEPVTMKMAKSQKTTLDPSKISGRCGRLMCCLRYEDHVYSELKLKLPKRGAIIVLEDDSLARVISGDVLLQKMVVEVGNGNQKHILVSAMKEVANKEQAQLYLSGVTTLKQKAPAQQEKDTPSESRRAPAKERSSREKSRPDEEKKTSRRGRSLRRRPKKGAGKGDPKSRRRPPKRKPGEKTQEAANKGEAKKSSSERPKTDPSKKDQKQPSRRRRRSKGRGNRRPGGEGRKSSNNQKIQKRRRAREDGKSNKGPGSNKNNKDRQK